MKMRCAQKNWKCGSLLIVITPMIIINVHICFYLAWQLPCCCDTTITYFCTKPSALSDVVQYSITVNLWLWLSLRLFINICIVDHNIVTSVPGLTSLRAASAAKCAAMIASAFLPVTLLSADAPTTTVCATTATNPSIWAPRSLERESNLVTSYYDRIYKYYSNKTYD